MPVSVDEMRAAFPRDTQGMETTELRALLDLEESALRAEFGVSSTEIDVDEPLSRAMRIGWPSFLLQVRQIASEQTSATGYTVTAARAGVIDFAWPSAIRAILTPVSDAAAAEAVAPTRGSQSIPNTFVW